LLRANLYQLFLFWIPQGKFMLCAFKQKF